MFGSFSDQLSVHLTDFLSDNPGGGERLRSFLRPRVNVYCLSHASKMPVDLREDVLQECILTLYSRGAAGFRCEQGTAAGYVFNLVRAAVQAILRRHGLSQSMLEPEGSEEIDLIETAIASFTCPPLPAPDEYQYRELASHALHIAGRHFGRVMWRVFVNGEPRDVVLKQANMSRFAFDRRRKAIAKSLATLPKCA